MYLTQPPRYFPDGTEYETRIDPASPNVDLVRLTRLYLFRAKYTLEGGTYQEFAELVVERMRKRIDNLLTTIDFQGIEEFNYNEQLEGLMILIRANLEAIIIGLHGYNSIPAKPRRQRKPVKNPFFAGVYGDYFPMMTPRAIFGTNLRLFIQRCFQDRRIRQILFDIIECRVFRDSEEQFLLLMERFHGQLMAFSYAEIPGHAQEDLYQEGLLVLQSCKQAYRGQGLIPLQWYLCRALKNKAIDLIRASEADKRMINKLSIPCTFGNGEALNADRAFEKTLVREWETNYFTWLNRNEGGGGGDDNQIQGSKTQYFTIDLRGNKNKILNEVTLLIFEEICSKLGERKIIQDFMEKHFVLPWNHADCMRNFIRTYWQGRIRILPLDISLENMEDDECLCASDLYDITVGEPDPVLLDILLAHKKAQLGKGFW